MSDYIVRCKNLSLKCLIVVLALGFASGTFANIITCNGISSKDDAVCGGHGECVAQDDCKCDLGWETDITYCDTSSYTCNGISAHLSTVCSGHGICTRDPLFGAGFCECDTGFGGEWCEDPVPAYCFGTASFDDDVCSGHGDCIKKETVDNEMNSGKCYCEPNYFSRTCAKWYCDGHPKHSSSVCSGHGTCVANDICDCNLGYTGPFCEELT